MGRVRVGVGEEGEGGGKFRRRNMGRSVWVKGWVGEPGVGVMGSSRR